MRRRRNITKEQRARGRLAVREHRDRVRRHLAVYLVVADEATLNLLVARGYLADAKTTDKKMVSRGLSTFLWDCAHGPILSRLH